MTTSALYVVTLDADKRRVGRPAVLWESDCVRCGNTTPDSMRCDECGRDNATVALFYDPQAYQYAEAVGEQDA